MLDLNHVMLRELQSLVFKVAIGVDKTPIKSGQIVRIHSGAIVDAYSTISAGSRIQQPEDLCVDAVMIIPVPCRRMCLGAIWFELATMSRFRIACRLPLMC